MKKAILFNHKTGSNKMENIKEYQLEVYKPEITEKLKAVYDNFMKYLKTLEMETQK